MSAWKREKGKAVRPALLAAGVAAVLCLPAVAGAGAGPAEVRVTSPAPGRVILEVADRTVTVRKEITRDRSTVTLTAPGDTVVLTVSRGVLSLRRGDGPVIVWGASGDDGQLLDGLRHSSAAARARALLARVPDGPETFVGQSLLLTRSILESATGDTGALAAYHRWVAGRAASARAGQAGRPGVARMMLASLGAGQLTGPEECWNLYSREAIRIAEDFVDCTEDLEWYEAHKYAGCLLIYSVRAEGAMAWFIACNGGVPFRG